eukprot:6206388-Pleurochrysis_carterae.AAC.2
MSTKEATEARNTKIRSRPRAGSDTCEDFNADAADKRGCTSRQRTECRSEKRGASKRKELVIQPRKARESQPKEARESQPRKARENERRTAQSSANASVEQGWWRETERCVALRVCRGEECERPLGRRAASRAVVGGG